MPNCPITFNNSKVNAALLRIVGRDKVRYATYTSIIKNDTFDKSFLTWYANKYPNRKAPALNGGNANYIANAMIEYCTREKPDGNLTVLAPLDENTTNYVSANDRVECTLRMADMADEVYREIHFGDVTRPLPKMYNQAKTEEARRDIYKKALTANVLKELRERIANLTGAKEADVIENIKKKGLAYIEEALGKDDMLTQDKNLLAIYKELAGPRSTEYVNEILNQSTINHVTKSITLDEHLKKEEEEKQADNQNLKSENGEELDASIQNYNSHMGEFKDFTAHIDEDIAAFLGSIPKLNSDEQDDKGHFIDFDKNNVVGLKAHLPAKAIMNLLYSYPNYTNQETMIESIDRLADTIAGFKGLKYLVKTLKENPDFAYKFYQNFSKAVLAKQEVTIADENSNITQANRASDKVTALTFEFTNSFRSTAINIDPATIDNLLNNLDKEVTSFNTEISKFYRNKQTLGKTQANNSSITKLEYDTKIRNLVSTLSNTLRLYLPTIDEAAILNYVKAYKKQGITNPLENQIAGIKSLIKDIRYLKLESLKVNEGYNKASNEYYKIRQYNKGVREEAMSGIWHKPDDYLDESTPWKTDYIPNETIFALSNIASRLAPYSLIKTELNSRTIYGKTASDVINSSMLTNLMKTLHSELNKNPDGTINDNSPIMKWANEKLRSSQYKLSGILIEHREGGTIINRGLFKLENGKYVPTEYADELIRISMFNGSRNINTGDSVSYVEMSKGDYVVSALINYLNNKKELKDGGVIGSYLMRIPSDAQHNFTFTAPAYATTGAINLFSRANTERNTQLINEANSKINTISIPNLKVEKTTQITEQEGLDLIKATISGSPISVKITSNISQENKEAKTSRGIVSFTHNTTLGEKTYFLAVEGTRDKTGNFENAKVISYIETNPLGSTDYNNVFVNEIYSAIDDAYGFDKEINPRHPIFLQYRNIIQQELNDMAKAAKSMFQYANGELVTNNGVPVLSDKAHRGGLDQYYDNYHFKRNKKGQIELTTNENGREVLTGNVFHSNKLTITDKKTGKTRNYIEEILNGDINDAGSISIIYGGLNGVDNGLHIDDNGNAVLTEAQQAKVDEAIKQFIIDYVNSEHERVSTYNNLFTTVKPTRNDITEFVLNYHLAYIYADDIFEGNSKFYKDAQDCLKRFKEVQGSGVPYGITDFLNPTGQFNPDGTPKDVEEDRSTLNSKRIQDELKAIDPSFNCKQRYGYRAITTRNVVRDLENIEDLRKQLYNNFIRLGFDKATSTRMAKSMMDNYTNIKTDDAQSYITFEEWVRRISNRGQLTQYLPLIKRILDRSKPISAEDIQQFIQVQKNFYYDMHYNADLGIEVPRQVKNAEFVLVPRLIEGTDLMNVYRLMKAANIDQVNTVETTKAGKANVVRIFDNNGSLVRGEDLAILKNQLANPETIEQFDYNHLYTQQETVQHMNSENKAAIQIMKKIIDNLDDKNPHKRAIVENYVANIQESFTNLMNEFGIELTPEGRLVLKNENRKDSRISGLDEKGWKKIYKRLEEEMLRQGLDSNVLDYITIDDSISLNGRPATKMDPYMSNVQTKLENIAQAIFNNNITRQKLPGFHAAQVAATGFGKGILTSKRLRYKPTDENGNPTRYVEVFLPKSAFNFKKVNGEYLADDETLLKQLQAENLDEIIGYRIPTEGKQSITIMKVVGFIDDSYGSTIVVPDGWVAQSGSDFDIDSIYAITKETTYEANSNAISEVKTRDARSLYNSYFFRSNELKDSKDRKAIYKTINKIQGNNALDSVDINAIKALINDENKATINSIINRIRLGDDITNIYDDIENLTNAEDKEAIYKIINETQGRSRKEENIEKEVNNYIDRQAKKLGLKPFDEWSLENKDRLDLQPRAVRNNNIVNAMISILKSDEALEENMGVSGAKDLTAARDAVSNKVEVAVRKARSPYNFMDQADFHEDATAGVKLKGMSVAADTFCSVCSQAKPYLSSENAINITYDFSNMSDEDFDTFAKRVEQRYNDNDVNVKVDKKTKTISVYHDKYGWSNDNRSISDKLLTAYSSQTTAYILDAIKEGALPNVTDYSFNAFKTLINLGIDYDAACTFIMQPGVRRVIDANNATNSIYSDTAGNPVHEAIRNIVKEILTLEGRSDEVLDWYSPRQCLKLLGAEHLMTSGEFIGIRSISLDAKALQSANLNIKALKDRINRQDKASTIDDLLQDLAVICYFNKLNNLAMSITGAQMCTNPDKFGAKQTIFATNDMMDKIKEQVKKCPLKCKVVGEDGNEKTISLISAIYPGIENGLDHYVSNPPSRPSAYPQLDAFLRTSTAVSIKVNREFFATQSYNFREIVNSLAEIAYSASKNRLTEEDAANFEKYVLGNLYSRTNIVARNLTYDVENKEVTYVASTGEDSSLSLSDQERERIFGFNRANGLQLPTIKTSVAEDGKTTSTIIWKRFEVSSITEPTQEDINNFQRLSPAQKVMFCQERFSDSLVFKYLSPNLSTLSKNVKTQGRHTIRFVEDAVNIETVRAEFYKAFNNSNPYLALAARDLIKYAAVVEGFKYGRTTINKIIPNKVLIDDFGNTGTGFMSDMRTQVQQIVDAGLEYEEIHTLVERYIRGSQCDSIPKAYIGRQLRSKYFVQNSSTGLIHIPINDETIGTLKNKNIIIERERQEPLVNNYVILSYGFNKQTLYRVKSIINEGSEVEGVILYPLNKLEENEQTKWSANEANNIHPSSEWFDVASEEFMNNYLAEPESATTKTIEWLNDGHPAERYVRRKKYVVPKEVLEEEEIIERNRGAWDALTMEVDNHFVNDNRIEGLMVNNAALNKLLPHDKFGETHAKMFNIGGNLYNVYRVNPGPAIPYVQNNNPIPNELYNFRHIIENARRTKANFVNAFMITKVKTTLSEDEGKVTARGPVIKYSAIGENIMDKVAKQTASSVGFINREITRTENKRAEEAVYRYENSQITSKVPSVKINMSDALEFTAQYLEERVNDLIEGVGGINSFTTDPDTGLMLTLTDAKTAELIRTNPTIRRNFIKLYLTCQDHIKRFEAYRALSMSTDDPVMKRSMEKIEKAIRRLETNKELNEAVRFFTENWLNQRTNDPRIQLGLLDVLDGYYSTSSFEAAINDIQDCSNPLVQGILADVMADIQAKQFHGRQAKKEFAKAINEIRKEAQRAGVRFDLDKLIDEDGSWYSEYKPEVRDKLKELGLKAKKLKLARTNDINSWADWIKADHEYKRYKLKHINQEGVDDYYKELLDNEEKLMNNNIWIYAKYKQLNYQLSQVLNRADVNGELDEADKKERNRLSREIDDLSNFTILGSDGIVRYKPDVTPPGPASIGGYAAASYLDNYLGVQGEIFKKYRTNIERAAFRDVLDRKLRIIELKEKKDSKGIITTPYTELENDKDYQEAKAWVRKNAHWVSDLAVLQKAVAAEVKAEDLDDYIDADGNLTIDLNTITDVEAKVKAVSAAWKYLTEMGKASPLNVSPSSALRTLAKDARGGAGAYDQYGRIDGSLLDDSQRAYLKQLQQNRLHYAEDNPYGERAIMGCGAPANTPIFTSQFWSGLRSDGMDNVTYMNLVEKANNILRGHWDSVNQMVKTDELSVDELNELLKIWKLLGYEEFSGTFDTKRGVKKTVHGTKARGEKIQKFIKKHVLFKTDDAKFAIAEQRAKERDKIEAGYYRAWCNINMEFDNDGNARPNHMIWGYAVPNPASPKYKQFVDYKKTAAVRILNDYYTTNTTDYYEKAKYEARKQATESGDENIYQKWFDDNHVYNPYTHEFEPLICWTRNEPKNDNTGHWEPNYSQIESGFKEDYKNPNYVKSTKLLRNFKTKEQKERAKSDPRLSTETYREAYPEDDAYAVDPANEYEKRARTLIQDTLLNLAKNPKAKKYIEEGYLPHSSAKPFTRKDAIKEVSKHFGWIDSTSGQEQYTEDISSDNDWVPTMPMLVRQLHDAQMGSVNFNEKEPTRLDGEDDASYNKRYDAWLKRKEAAEKINKDIHRKILNRDWEDVIGMFIEQAHRFNAIQDNKYQLYLGQKLLEHADSYIERNGIAGGDFVKNTKESTDAAPEYAKTSRGKDQLLDWYTNFIRRLVFDQWKRPNATITRAMNIAQTLTSATYMTLNLRGGIANVTVGESNILGEAAAREYFNGSEWTKASYIYGKSIPDYLTHLWNDKASTVAGAFIKGMHVVDYDEKAGVVKLNNPTKVSKAIRDFEFSTLSSGEHLMQNKVLIAMALSHKLVPVTDPYVQNHKGVIGSSAVLVNEDEYMAHVEEEALMSLLTDEQKDEYNNRITEIMKDPNKAKEYVWFRKNLIHEYVKSGRLTKKEAKQYHKTVKEYREKAREKFKTYDSLYDNMDLGTDGEMAFKKDSTMDKLNVIREGQEVSDAYQILGKFKQRVISVNKKIHGNYGKLDAARMEREWYGALVMQYHKHIYPGWMKRFRTHGYFNEERGTTEKGSYVSTYNFLLKPLLSPTASGIGKAWNALNDFLGFSHREAMLEAGATEEEVRTTESVQGLFTNILDYYAHLGLAYNILPESEKANIRRALNDTLSVLSAVALAIFLRVIGGGGDDKDKGVLWNLAIYEADRLASETWMWNPYGAIMEAKKLWSTPVASQSIVTDGIKIMAEIGQWMMYGDEYNGVFKTGRFAGRRKLSVYFERRIPIWRNIVSLRDIDTNNSYYKVADNPIGIIPVRPIAAYIADDPSIDED